MGNRLAVFFCFLIHQSVVLGNYCEKWITLLKERFISVEEYCFIDVIGVILRGTDLSKVVTVISIDLITTD